MVLVLNLMVGCVVNYVFSIILISKLGGIGSIEGRICFYEQVSTMRTSWFKKNPSRKSYQCPIRKVIRNDISMKMYINDFNIFSCVTCA